MDPNEMPPISLRAQIEELEYELSMRRSVYARLDRAEPSGKSARDLHMARMEAAKATLEQLMARTNETQTDDGENTTARAPAVCTESQR
jgi:hypothetical protein